MSCKLLILIVLSLLVGVIIIIPGNEALHVVSSAYRRSPLTIIANTPNTIPARRSLRLCLRPDNSHFSDEEGEEEGYLDEQRGDQRGRGPGRKKTLASAPVVLDAKGKWNIFNKAILAGIFVAGIGTGINLDSAINTNPKDLASRDAIDRNAPNPKLCATFGASAMVVDQRVFVTFNPFNVYVTQADTKPGCVLRPANVVPLLQRERSLLTDEEVDSCKNGFNTWAFVGDINSKPQLSCVFQSDDAQNEFLSNPKIGLGEDVYDGQQSSK